MKYGKLSRTKPGLQNNKLQRFVIQSINLSLILRNLQFFQEEFLKKQILIL